MTLRYFENFGKCGGLKFPLDRCEAVQKTCRIGVVERKPDVLLPVLPKPLVVVDESANLLEQFPRARHEEPLDASLGDRAGAEADILLAVINPVDLRITLGAKNQVLLVVIRSDRVNELTDAAMLRVVGVHSVFLFGGLDGMLNDPSGQTTLGNLGDKMPVRFVVRTVTTMLRAVRPMPNRAPTWPLGNKRSLTDGTLAVRVVSIVVVPHRLACMVVNHSASLSSKSKVNCQQTG